jgi:hypothetical protein
LELVRIKKILTYNENNKIAGVPEHFNLPWHLAIVRFERKISIYNGLMSFEGTGKCAKCFVMVKLILQ